MTRSTLQAAATQIQFTPTHGTRYGNLTKAAIDQIAGPLSVTLTLLRSGDQALCLLATDLAMLAVNESEPIRTLVGQRLGLAADRVLIFSSHNHCDIALVENPAPIYIHAEARAAAAQPPRWNEEGKKLLEQLRAAADTLPGRLQPVTVAWAQGSEGRITYNRKARRADGSTILVRECDRRQLGQDYSGDIDRQAPVVLLLGADGKPVTVLTQFTGHPITSYHPERPIVFGEWPRVACDMLAQHLSPDASLPVSFLQGCAGDINSKFLLEGSVELSRKFGRWLGQSYIDALPQQTTSQRGDMDYRAVSAAVPLAPLPPLDELQQDLAEIDRFVARAEAGDPDTLSCVGLNFPPDLSPIYRSRLVEHVRNWTTWAIQQHINGTAADLPRTLEMTVHVLRLGDVAIIGMPCEPFQAIGRQIRAGSPLPLTIPCGYTNHSQGYITDSTNTGDREYMSSFHRYTRYRPPLAKPAGDVMAQVACQALAQMCDAPAATTA